MISILKDIVNTILLDIRRDKYWKRQILEEINIGRDKDFEINIRRDKY